MADSDKRVLWIATDWGGVPPDEMAQIQRVAKSQKPADTQGDKTKIRMVMQREGKARQGLAGEVSMVASKESGVKRQDPNQPHLQGEQGLTVPPLHRPQHNAQSLSQAPASGRLQTLSKMDTQTSKHECIVGAEDEG